MNTEGLKAVIFDMGGTLMDYDPVPWQEMKAIRRKIICDFLNARGYSFTEADIEKRLLDRYYDINQNHCEETMEEIDLVDFFKTTLRSLGVVEDYSLWLTRLMHISLKKNLIVYKDTAETLARLSERYTLGLISNTTIPGVYFAADLEELGFDKHFRHMLFTADLGMRKPHASVFNRMLKLLGLKPHETLYVGDSFKNDVYGPSKLGMKTAWISNGYAPKPSEYADITPDLTIRSIGELIDRLM